MPDDVAALELAHSYLPPMVRWAHIPALAAVASFAGWFTAVVGARAGGRLPRGTVQLPWPERARRAFPARVGASLGVGVAAFVGLILATSFGGPWGVASGWPASLLGCAAAVVGAVAAADRVDGRLGVGVGLRTRLRDLASWALALHGVFVVAVFFAGLATVVTAWGKWPWIVAGALALAALARDPLALLRLTRMLRPAPEPLRRAVERFAARTGTRLSGGVHVLRWSGANAFAYQVPAAIVLTEGALARFSDDELLAICGHELAHLREPRRVVALRTGTGLAKALPFLAAPVGPTWLTGALLLVSFVVGRRVQARLRPYELVADAAAGAVEESPGDYAWALERLHEVSLMPAVVAGEQSHPHLVARLAALGHRPAYAAIAPPVPRRVGGAVLGTVAAGVAALVGVTIALAIVTHARPALAVTLTAGDTLPLMAYASARARDEPELARALVQACLVHEGDSVRRDERCSLGRAEREEESP